MKENENQLKAATDLLISALKSKAKEVSEGYIYDEYKLDDGQMKIEVKYQSISDVLNLVNDIDKTNVSKVVCLTRLLESYSTPNTTFKSDEQNKIKAKIFELIDKF